MLWHIDIDNNAAPGQDLMGSNKLYSKILDRIKQIDSLLDASSYGKKNQLEAELSDFFKKLHFFKNCI